jgi:hypothetical protein
MAAAAEAQPASVSASRRARYQEVVASVRCGAGAGAKCGPSVDLRQTPGLVEPDAGPTRVPYGRNVFELSNQAYRAS